jgi:ribosomal protein S27AE
MPQPHNLNLTMPPIGKRRCPNCGQPMFLSVIEPSEDIDHDQRTFECSLCAYAETMTVRIRE